MKLAVVSPFLPEISGVGQYGVRVAEALANTRRFSAVHVLANARPGAPRREQRGRLNIERVWARDRYDVAPSILAAILRLRPDVVWFNLGLSMYGSSRVANFLGHAAPALVRLAGIPAVATLHELFETANLRAIGATNGRVTQWGGALATRMILQADAVCLTLKSYLQLVRERYGAHSLFYIPHGAFDPPRFAPLPASKRALYFGSHAPYKGLPALIAMYRELRATDSALRLTIVGSDHPRFPGYFDSVRAAANDLPGIEWRPNMPEDQLPAVFESAQVVVLPYAATTGASSVTHRAAAHGRPIVAYRLPDLQAVAAEENLRVEFVTPGDPAAFTARLKSLLGDPAECERIGRENAAAMQAHTLEHTCRRYAEVFESVVARRLILRQPVTGQQQEMG